MGVIDFKHITPAGIPPKTQSCPLNLSPCPFRSSTSIKIKTTGALQLKYKWVHSHRVSTDSLKSREEKGGSLEEINR